MEKKNKKNNIIIVILIIIIVALVGFILLKELNILSKNENKTEKKVTSKSLNEEKVVELVKENLVYTKNFFDDEICYESSQNSLKICSSNIILPYINIDSDDASKINESISHIANDNYKLIKNSIDNNYELNEVKTNYNFYIYKNLLSIVISETTGSTDVPLAHYYSYMLDLTTGSKVNEENIYSYLRSASELDNIVTKDSIEKIEKRAIKNSMYQYRILYSLDEDKMENVTNECYKEFKNSGKLFVNNAGELNIIAGIETGAGIKGCAHETIINLYD